MEDWPAKCSMGVPVWYVARRGSEQPTFPIEQSSVQAFNAISNLDQKTVELVLR
jgi:hypothetical protein